MSRVTKRRATPDDLRNYAGRDLPEWCARWLGYAAERDGEVIAIGLVCWDREGNATGWVDEKEPIPAMLKHRLAVRVLNALRQIGEKRIGVICDASKDGAAMWLERLGFRPGELTEHGQVWRCELVRTHQNT